MLRFRQQIDMDYMNERVKRHTENDWEWARSREREREKVSEWCLSMCMFVFALKCLRLLYNKNNGYSYKANSKFSFNIYSIHFIWCVPSSLPPFLRSFANCDTDNMRCIHKIQGVFFFFFLRILFPSISLCSSFRSFFKLLINANWFRISTIDNCHRCQNTL